MNLYLDIDDELLDTYDEDTNPGGLRRVLEDAGLYLHNAVALWRLLGEEDRASGIAVLLRTIQNAYAIERLFVVPLTLDEVARLAELLDGIVEAAERTLVDRENWRVHPDQVERVERASPGLGYFTTDGKGARIYSLSKCLSELHMTHAYLQAAIDHGYDVLVE